MKLYPPPTQATIASASLPTRNLLPGDYAALIGFDWGDASHATVLRVRGQVGLPQIRPLEHSAENLHAWLEGLRQRFQGAPVALALEGIPRPVVAALLEHSAWLTVYTVHPKATHGLRNAVYPSGAKDDTPDALLLLSLLESYRQHLFCLNPPEPIDERLELLTAARRKAVDQRTAVSNELKALLKGYFPQALKLGGTLLHSAIFRDFLHRWPELAALQRSRAGTLLEFYKSHRASAKAIEKRLELLASARPLTSDRALIEVSIQTAQMLLELLAVQTKHIDALDDDIAQIFETHPDYEIFANLPGAGAALAPRLATLFGSRRSRWLDPRGLQCYAGVAPITRKSGNRRIVLRRRAKPRHHHQTLVEWSGQTILSSRWARAFYFLKRAAGHDHWAILRALACRWINILWRCWIDRLHYDETRYLQALQQQNSPLHQYLKKHPNILDLPLPT